VAKRLDPIQTLVAGNENGDCRRPEYPSGGMWGDEYSVRMYRHLQPPNRKPSSF